MVKNKNFQQQWIDFAEKYGFEVGWSLIKYRPQIARTAPFGPTFIRGTGTRLGFRIHLGTDRGPGHIFAPFDIEKTLLLEDFHGFGNMVILTLAEADVQVRIAHLSIDRLDSDFLYQARRGVGMKAGTYLGLAGKAGILGDSEKDGTHTHTEIVSTKYTSVFCDKSLEQRNCSETIIDERWVEDEYGKEFIEIYESELKMRKVDQLTTLRCVRKDYLDGKTKTFYDSRTVFSI